MVDARLKITLGIGLVTGVTAIAVTLSQAPVTVARVNTPTHTDIGSTNRAIAACQPDEVLPRGITAIRLRIFAFLGPRVTVEVLARGRVIAHGERGSGWTGGAVTVPVTPRSTATSGTQLCFALFANGDESDELVGAPAAGALAAHDRDGSLHGRVRAEYLRPGGSSWWSLARAVARRMSLGRGWPGAASVPLAVILIACVVLLSCALIVRSPR